MDGPAGWPSTRPCPPWTCGWTASLSERRPSPARSRWRRASVAWSCGVRGIAQRSRRSPSARGRRRTSRSRWRRTRRARAAASRSCRPRPTHRCGSTARRAARRPCSSSRWGSTGSAPSAPASSPSSATSTCPPAATRSASASSRRPRRARATRAAPAPSAHGGSSPPPRGARWSSAAPDICSTTAASPPIDETRSSRSRRSSTRADAATARAGWTPTHATPSWTRPRTGTMPRRPATSTATWPSARARRHLRRGSSCSLQGTIRTGTIRSRWPSRRSSSPAAGWQRSPARSYRVSLRHQDHGVQHEVAPGSWYACITAQPLPIPA